MPPCLLVSFSRSLQNYMHIFVWIVPPSDLAHAPEDYFTASGTASGTIQKGLEVEYTTSLLSCFSQGLPSFGESLYSKGSYTSM